MLKSQYLIFHLSYPCNCVVKVRVIIKWFCSFNVSKVVRQLNYLVSSYFSFISVVKSIVSYLHLHLHFNYIYLSFFYIIYSFFSCYFAVFSVTLLIHGIVVSFIVAISLICCYISFSYNVFFLYPLLWINILGHLFVLVYCVLMLFLQYEHFICF